MGKGDKKTRRGKITIGSAGVRRQRKKKSRKNVIIPKAAPLPKETPVIAPVEVAPEVTPVIEQVEEKVTKKAPAKPAAKKATVKTEEGEPKPKQAKSRKKPAAPAEDLFTEIKEETE